MGWILSESHPHLDKELSLIIKGCCIRKSDFKSMNALIPFPQSSSCFNFIFQEPKHNLFIRIKNKIKDHFNKTTYKPTPYPLPVQLLLYLWHNNDPEWRGDCPECSKHRKGSIFGIGSGGLLSVGGIMGHCVFCHKRYFYFIGGGIVKVREHLEYSLRDTNITVYNFKFGGCFRGEKEPVYYYLKKLGYTELPHEKWLGIKTSSDAEMSIKTKDGGSVSLTLLGETK